MIMSIAGLQQHNNLQYAYVGDFHGKGYTCFDHPPMSNIPLSRWAKVNLLSWSPFKHILYIDADTRPRGDLSMGFDILADGWDLAIVPSNNQESDCIWHVGVAEREQTLTELGYIPLQLQAGVMYIAKNERTRLLFQAWQDEWRLFGDQDQAALLRALYHVPVRVWLLGKAYNGGALISHLFGKATA
jgi:hypothetical protein